MEFDLQTIVGLGILDTLAIAIFFIFVCRSRQFGRTIVFLGPAYIALSVGLILVSFGKELHDVFSILIANTLIYVWLIGVWRTVRSFQKILFSWRQAAAILSAFFVLFAVFTFVYPDLNNRILVFSAFSFVLSTRITLDILKPVHSVKITTEQKFLSAVFVLFSGFMMLRLLVAVSGGYENTILSENLERITFVLIEMIVVLFSFGMIWLLSRQLERQVFEKAAELAIAYENSEKSRELAEESSVTDALTKIGNRRKFDKAIEQERDRHLRYGREMCIAFLDLDHFKTINDTHGHDVGDEVLRNFVFTVNELIRTIDQLYRWGGEEFVLLMPETALDEALEVCERIRARTELALRVGEDVVTVSIGVAQMDNMEALKELIARGDKLMYQAKRDGRNCVVS